MSRLHRYLFGSVALSGLAGVALFGFILVSGNAMSDLLGLLADGRITLQLFGELLLLLLPFAIAYAMPLGLLVGILLTMGRLSAQQELTAMRAAGVGMGTIAAPILLFALLASGASVYVNAVYAPSARANYKEILNDLVRTDPLRFIVPKTFIHDFPGYVIYVGGAEAGRLQEFWLWELDADRRAVRLVRAREGQFRYDEAGDALILTLVDGFAELRDEKAPDALHEIQPTLSFRSTSVRLPLASILGDANRPRDIDQFTAQDLWKMRAESLAAQASAEDDAARQAARESQILAQYHLSRHFAMGTSGLALAMIAIPLGIKASRKETHANLGLALALALCYYVAMTFVDMLENNLAARPDLIAWVPNFVCQGLGAWAIMRADRN